MQMNILAAFDRQFVHPEDFGPDVDTWKEQFVAFVKIVPLSGHYRIQAQQVKESVTHRIITHYRPDIHPDMRIRELDAPQRTFHLRSVIEDERRSTVELQAESV
jgi:SPP1 family predicted phage head-tail adaptor